MMSNQNMRSINSFQSFKNKQNGKKTRGRLRSGSESSFVSEAMSDTTNQSMRFQSQANSTFNKIGKKPIFKGKDEAMVRVKDWINDGLENIPEAPHSNPRNGNSKPKFSIHGQTRKRNARYSIMPSQPENKSAIVDKTTIKRTTTLK